MELRAVAIVESPLRTRAEAPKQGREGAPDAWLAFVPDVAEALADVAVGDRLILLTWLDRADRSVRRVRPRDDPARPLTGVFSTRSPDRPNPIGLHEVTVLEVDGLRVRVSGLERSTGRRSWTSSRCCESGAPYARDAAGRCPSASTSGASSGRCAASASVCARTASWVGRALSSRAWPASVSSV